MRTLEFSSHSSDGKVRLSASMLYRIGLGHLYTEVLHFAASGRAQTGTTEWSGQFRDRVVSLAWDWRKLDDGGLVESFEYQARSNLMIVCDRGYDQGVLKTDLVLQAFVRTLPWREEVGRAIQEMEPPDRPGYSATPRGESAPNMWAWTFS